MSVIMTELQDGEMLVVLVSKPDWCIICGL